MMNERVAIVVPVFNRATLVTRCLDSVYAQSYRPLHLVVVDNASTDGTLDAVTEWAAAHESPDFTITILSEERKGAAYARRKGLDNVAEDVVMFFDSDDVMRYDSVRSAMAMFEARPEADLVAWPVMIHHESAPVRTHAIKGDLLERHLVHALLRTQGYAAKTELVRRAGGWKGEFRCWDDLETGTRILLQRPVVVSIDRPLADVYPQKESITGVDFSSKAGEWEKSLDSIERYIATSDISGKDRYLRIVSYRRAILAAHYKREGRTDLALPLYHKALKDVAKSKRPLIRFSYHWTALGLRGAFSIVGRFL